MPRLAYSSAIALAGVMLLAACASPVGGTPVAGPKYGDQAFFFAGEVPLYGQSLSDQDVAYLAYLRALRRIDVCGLLTGDALAKVGEIVSVGTLFAFNECDAELKVSGVGQRRLVSVELIAVADTPGECDFDVPLPLERLPGAPPASIRPLVRVGLIGSADCGLAGRIGDALTTRLAAPLPPRDAAANYPVPLAERDPCEVLSAVAVVHWDVEGSGPYECRFNGNVRVKLQPRVVESDPPPCSAISFVGAPMQRKVIGGGYLESGDVVIRAAVVVDTTDGRDCNAVGEVMTAAARLYS